jgi:transcription elongation factor Elf1
MQVTFGKHSGKSVEALLLKEPAYIKWVLEQSPSGALLAVKNEAKRLIGKFDSRPYEVRCNSCNQVATRATVYLDNLAAHWWCGNCNPYSLGANPGKLQEIRTYSQALQHVECYCRSRQGDFASLIKQLAKAKGLPERATEKKIVEFFSGT